MLDKNNILILCKVVDNFGDIGVVYRLARALSDLRPSVKLTLVVSNLESFHKMASAIDPKKQIQDFHYKNSVWKIIDWNLQASDFQLKAPVSQFSIILECFQCGRPDWLEKLLFSEDFTETVQILNIDYLTAEDYAEEFHLLKSGTRKANIKKRFFMPGFTEKTGGLIINDFPGASAAKAAAGLSDVPLSLHCSPRFAHSATASPHLQSLAHDPYKIFFFAYDDDCSSLVRGIADFQKRMRKTKPDFSVSLYLAEGKSQAPFEKSWESEGKPFVIKKLDFMQQEDFDSFILGMDFLFVRGEDSLARAALSGLPFVWQAYKQDENYQLVKVNALIDSMKKHFSDDEFQKLKKAWQSYNDYEQPTDEKAIADFLTSSGEEKNTASFREFSERLHKNGNLASHLLSFIDGLD